MDSKRYQRIQDLFHEASDLPDSERNSHLKAACGSDLDLMADVVAMLAADARGTSLLDRGVAQVAHGVLGGSLPLPTGLKEFGAYRIQKLLGEGGMGVVYLALREDLHSLVAIKILRDAWLSPSRRERFAIEQR